VLPSLLWKLTLGETTGNKPFHTENKVKKDVIVVEIPILSDQNTTSQLSATEQHSNDGLVLSSP